ncbi:hypothetical protein ACFYOK_38760 [Microbispora bryophytorum]|uniref:hypothetical protein n=1 Tax=Microbispora bryophytorum TaxID=1460882 RepID=UPI0033D66AED
MPYKDFGIEEARSADINTYLMRQMVITCTSSTRPASPVTGMRIWETDTSVEWVWDGTAWRVIGGFPQIAYKSVTETVTNSTTVQDDDHLFLPVSANSTYVVEALVRVDSPRAADFRVAWSAPSGNSFNWVTHAPHTNLTDPRAATISVNGFNSATAGADIGGDQEDFWAIHAFIKGLLQTSSSGTFRLRWAQSSANSTGASVLERSYLQLIRVA